MSDDVAKWIKRLSRKGPFHLLRTEAFSKTRYDHSVKPSRAYEVPATRYWVIWNDGEKTKIGSFSDFMLCRYGVATCAVLNGDTPFDLWNGAGFQDDFPAMLAVRNGTSDLPHFGLADIQGLSW